MKLQIRESRKQMNPLSSNCFDIIKKALEKIGFTVDLDEYDKISFLNELHISASNDENQFITIYVQISEDDDGHIDGVNVNFNADYKKRFKTIDDATDYIVQRAESDKYSYDTKQIKKRKQLLCMDCINKLRRVNGKRVKVLPDSIPQRRLRDSDKSWHKGERLCTCDRCNNEYPENWIHVCEIS